MFHLETAMLYENLIIYGKNISKKLFRIKAAKRRHQAQLDQLSLVNKELVAVLTDESTFIKEALKINNKYKRDIQKTLNLLNDLETELRVQQIKLGKSIQRYIALRQVWAWRKRKHQTWIGVETMEEFVEIKTELLQSLLYVEYKGHLNKW